MSTSIRSGRKRHWLKHMAVAPKGLLRYYVLEILSKEPKSGSDIMDFVEEYSGGLWRPSPGSIYPLLELLRDKGYIKEIQRGETTTRKYTLTEKGWRLLEEQRRAKILMMISWRLFAPHFLDLTFFNTCSNERRELLRELKNFMQALFSLEAELREKDDKEYIESVTTILKDASLKLKELRKKMEMRMNE
ncbi:MAG: PadR family transcriptional regulator [Nitrososphaerota archaeon]